MARITIIIALILEDALKTTIITNNIKWILEKKLKCIKKIYKNNVTKLNYENKCTETNRENV